MDTQTFGNNHAQPINSITTSVETAYADEALSQQQKAHFTRAEKRQFTKEKKAAQHLKQQSKKPSHKRDVGALPKSCNSIDDVIAYLVSIRGQASDRKVKESLTRVTKSLEGRITRDTPKKVEPSAKKLEKIQKRKEIRAEKRKAWLAQKAGQGGQSEQTQVAEAAPAVQQQAPVPEFDEINFDEL